MVGPKDLFVNFKQAYNEFVNYVVKTINPLGSGCGSNGRLVASNNRGGRFEYYHRRNFNEHVYCQLGIEKTKIK